MIEIQGIWEVILKVLPVIITILIYWFGVVRTNERQNVEILNMKNNIDSTCKRIDKLDNDKVDKYSMDLLINTLNRIDNKIDKLQEQINKK